MNTAAFPNIPQNSFRKEVQHTAGTVYLGNRSYRTTLHTDRIAFLSKGIHSLNNRDYFKTNPEFYSMMAGSAHRYSLLFKQGDGERNSSGTSKSICRSDDNISISVSMSDGVDVCHCPECENLQKNMKSGGARILTFCWSSGRIHEDPSSHHYPSLFYQRGQTQIRRTLYPGKISSEYSVHVLQYRVQKQIKNGCASDNRAGI